LILIPKLITNQSKHYN